jgi:arsenite methyltransferase
MLARAESIKERTNATNTRFVKGRITDIPVESNIANCILSNCVVNLVPEVEKLLVFNEIFRLLKAGGRVAISDILAKKPLSDHMKQDVALYCGCIAGASLVEDYKGYLMKAGFKGKQLPTTD